MPDQSQIARVEWLLSKAQSLTTMTQWETDFVNKLTDLSAKHGVNLRISDRQEEILEQICNKD